jgi:hypothetical protein
MIDTLARHAAERKHRMKAGYRIGRLPVSKPRIASRASALGSPPNRRNSVMDLNELRRLAEAATPGPWVAAPKEGQKGETS